MINRYRCALLAILALPALHACGTHIKLGGHGGGGTGGDGTGGSGAGGQAMCPAQMPDTETDCALPEGWQCYYGDRCCPTALRCFEGIWVAGDSGDCQPSTQPGQEPCPATPPQLGAACSLCPSIDNGACEYACPGTKFMFTARCDSGTWTTPDGCPPLSNAMCGSATCSFGEVCVQTAGGAAFSYTCQPNPCFPEALSCACAAQLCGGAPHVCNVTGAQQLSCDCPTCA